MKVPKYYVLRCRNGWRRESSFTCCRRANRPRERDAITEQSVRSVESGITSKSAIKKTVKKTAADMVSVPDWIKEPTGSMKLSCTVSIGML